MKSRGSGYGQGEVANGIEDGGRGRSEEPLQGQEEVEMKVDDVGGSRKKRELEEGAEEQSLKYLKKAGEEEKEEG